MTSPECFSARLLARESIALDTEAYFFERPSGFSFEAGQYVSVKLIDFKSDHGSEDDGERMLSIASSPQDPHIMVAMRMRGTPFKRHLSNCSPGSSHPIATIGPAMGDFLLPQHSLDPVVMIAGGIGITPFYSMLRDLQHKSSGGAQVPPVTLMYGNRTRNLVVWRNELERLGAALPALRTLHYIVDDPGAPSGDDGGSTWRDGLITAEAIRREIRSLRTSRYYVVGPTAMVATMQDCLDECDVPPDRVTIEFFAGY